MTKAPQDLRSRSASDMAADFDSIRAWLVTLTTETGRDVPLNHVYMEKITITIERAIGTFITSQRTREEAHSGASQKMISSRDPAVFQTRLNKAKQLIVQEDEQVF